MIDVSFHNRFLIFYRPNLIFMVNGLKSFRDFAKPISFLIIVHFFISLRVNAQAARPPAYEIKSDTAFKQDIEYVYWQLLEDKEGKWTIEQVSRPPLADKFHDSLNNLKGIDTTARANWFRYRLKNTMDHPVKIALESHSEQDEFYFLKSGGKWDHFITGDLYPWNKKDGFKDGNYIPVIIQPGGELIAYDRSYNKACGMTGKFYVGFVNTEKEMEREFNIYNGDKYDYFELNELLEAFIIGLLFISIFFNLFFYRIADEKVYLYFSLFLFFLGINRLWNIAGLYTWWVYPALNEYVYYLVLAWGFILVFLIQFIRHFFKTFNEYPRWDKFLVGLALLDVLAYTGYFFSMLLVKRALPAFLLITGLLLSVIPFFVLVTLLLFIRRLNSFRKLVIIGAFPLLFFYGVISPFIATESPIAFSSQSSPLVKWLLDHFRGEEAVCLIWLVLFFSWVLFLRYNQLRKENAQQAFDKERLQKEKEIERNLLIAQQKIDLEKQVIQRTAELKQSFENLQSTQKQLTQSEKMASLGELTAGIAHEIQNPLNFVNNFSEVNQELIDEASQANESGNSNEVKELLLTLKDNEDKINHHGKRADAIVKGMLQHSRSSSGQKEPTDINALADEYLRLAYHGLRAKDKSFNAETKTDFDEGIGKISIIPQDVGRVLLNLFNNAFYAVAEKSKQRAVGYESKVSVSTLKLPGKIEITVKDNGNGIPEKVIDKIFQPFFTTKPTGQGTGLGLSLSYDIIKAHGGELKVNTTEGEYTEFVIELPVNDDK